MRFFCLSVLICASACADFPVLDDTIGQAAINAPYPKLTPLPANLGGNTTIATGSLAARIAALNGRADRLRRTDVTTLQ